MEWEDILIALISVSASTVLNIIINCINNNMPFFKNKRKQKEVKKICPELVCLYTRNTNDIKSITDGSSFFEVIFDVKVDNDLKPDKKVSFSEIKFETGNFENKALITLINRSCISQLLYFIYSEDEKISLNELRDSFLSNDQKITLIFDVKDLPKKIQFSVNNTLCVYDISKRLSDNGLITPEIQLRSDY